MISVYIEHEALSVNKLFTYACDEPVKPGCRVRVPFGKHSLTGIVAETDVPDPGRDVKSVLEVIDPEPFLNEELMDLAQEISDASCASLASIYKTMLPPALKPQSGKKHVVMEDWFEPGDSTEPLTPKQQAALDLLKPELPMKASAARKLTGLCAKLKEKGYLVLSRRPALHWLGLETARDEKPQLKESQKQALDQIRAARQDVILLHGVTGSGKTEVFLRLAEEVIAQGKQVLFLVPEIGLTPMMVRRVCARFGPKIAVCHSQLSDQEKYSQFELVRTGQVQIVVGTRSAVFLPFQKLGLILMDEEHDASYKQDDKMPRYHARDVALARAKRHGCRLVLASATPSLESYARAYKQVYGLVNMPVRINEQVPAVRFCDLRTEPVKAGLAASLIEAIQDRLAKGEQVILLLNRRGYLPIVRCSGCGQVRVCPDCGIPLSYHKKENRLVCHCCGLAWNFDPVCPACHSHQTVQTGMGTEKLEELVQSLFPQARIVRMDADSTRRKNAHLKLLAEFEQSGDILLGTQMVAKGLDFPRVTLVGILQADAGLMRMDWRAAESTYQMLEQAAGRAGRAEAPGEVLVQTFQEEHHVLQAVKDHSYRDFFVQEMQYRNAGGYPPYVYLCTLVFRHDDEQKAWQKAEQAKALLSENKVLGPAPISMRSRQARVRLVVKDKDPNHLKEQIWKVIHQLPAGTVKMEVNMHPMHMED